MAIPKERVGDIEPHETALDISPPVPSVAPTLADAFHVLGEALAACYVEDNMPAYLLCQDALMIYANGGAIPTHPNSAQAWRMLLLLLEQALGATLRVT